jgi:glycosyltransferase involved in cell wall biosynthesis
MKNDDNTKKILSVCVAAYNMERYLDDCLSSFVVGEHMDALEILVLDDCSRDRTLEIALRYAEKYPLTFNVIRGERNAGYGSVVQKGIEMATGKYFMVVDADDWVNADAFRDVIGFLKTCDADLVLFDRIICYEDNENTSRLEIEKGDFNYNTTLPIAEAASAIWDFSIHHMMVKTSILHDTGIRLGNGFYTDIELTWFPLPRVKTFVVNDACIKTYRRRAGQSTTAVNCYNHRQDMELVLMRLTRSLEEIRQQRLSREHMRLMERKLAGAMSLYICWMLNVPFSVPVYGLSTEMRRLYRALKPEFDKMENPGFEFFPRQLIRLNFYCLLPLRATYKVVPALLNAFFNLVNRVLPEGTNRRLAVRSVYRKVRRFMNATASVPGA